MSQKDKEVEPQFQQLEEAIEERNKRFWLLLVKLYLEGEKSHGQEN